MDRVILTELFPDQDDRLVSPQSGRLADRIRIDSPVLEVGLGACNKEGLRLIQDIKSGKVDIVTIHDVEADCLEDHLIEDVHIVQFAVRNINEGRNIAAQIEKCMGFDGAFVFAKTHPWKGCQAQVDGCRMNAYRMLQLDTETVLCVELASRLDQAEEEVLINAPVACLVGIVVQISLKVTA